MLTLFKDRREAGRLLASQMKTYANRPATLVLGIPRGGVPVAFEVAQALNLPLDAYVVRKLGVPGQEELAMGAIAPGGVYVLDHAVVEAMHISEDDIQTVLRKEQQELLRRERLYRKNQPPVSVTGKTILIIDDGLATGSSMRAAIRMLRQQQASRIVVGVPVGPAESCQTLRQMVDDLVCVRTLESAPYFAIGCWYQDFSPTSDEEVCDLLHRANQQGLCSAA